MAEYVVVDKEQLETYLTVVADAIREKGGTSEPLAFPNGMANAVRGIQIQSTNWLDYATSITRMFQGAIFQNDSEIDISFGSKAQYDALLAPNLFDYAFYRANGVKSVEMHCDLNVQQSSYTYMFEGVTGEEMLKTIDISGIAHILPTNMMRFVYHRDGLIEIIGVLNLSLCTNTGNAFTYCKNLKEIRFVENTIKLSISFAQSSKLSAESIQSIIDGLADLTGGTAQILTFHADVKAKLTEEQIATITSKNWTLA